MTRPRRVAILIFDEVEVLDFCGPFEVFSVAGRQLEGQPFEVMTVAAGPGPITARGGLSVNPAYTIDDCPPPDILLVPGGFGVRQALLDDRLVRWVAQIAARAGLTLSVCTGSALLGRAGLLNGQAATTHYSAFDLLRQHAPGARVVESCRYVDNGSLITSAGISAGIDMALHVVERLLGADAARQTAAYMEYRRVPPADTVIETERLRLRRFQPEDASALHRAVYGGAEVMRYLPGGQPRSPEQVAAAVARFADHWAAHGFGAWAVEERENGTLIGEAGLQFVPGSSDVEVFYALTPEAWGRGLAAEAGRAALRYGFEHRGLARIVGLVVPENAASRRVLEKLGLHYTGDAVHYDLAVQVWAVEAGAFDSGSGPLVLIE